ncbi:MAG: EAL domain-containing protein, partial [Cetobacterium sp.]|uniref:EAL domain-containing protein n=1 Tax=Cetobacterium sp. TaxID=2071632 RepID=UPI003F3D9C21
MIYRFFSIFFLLFFNLTFSNIYVPKTPNEEKVFSKLKKEKITIALIDEPFYNLSYPDVHSLNDTIQSFFKDYIQLDVEFKTVSYKNLQNEVKSGAVDGVALIPKNNFYDEYLDFSDDIFSEKLFVVSQDKPIDCIKDLNNKIIYTSYMEPYKYILDAILANNDLNSYHISVEDLTSYQNKLILTANPILYKPNYGIKIGNFSGVTVALSHKYSEMLPSINNALNSGYREIFFKNLVEINRLISYNNFYSSLTPEEKKYLETLSPIEVSYENRSDSLVSYKSKVDGKYKGIAPNIFKILKNNLNIDFIDVTNEEYKTTDNLKNNEFDTMLLSKTRRRGEDFVFSKKIYDIEVYLVRLNTNPSCNGSVGVLKNNVEEHLAQRYYVNEDIIVFDDFKSMINALKTGKIGSLLATDKRYFNSNRYDIIPFEIIPINLAFNRDHEVLRNIIDKAFRHSIDLKNLTELSELERDLEYRTIATKEKESLHTLIFFSLLFVILALIMSGSLYKRYLNKKTLLNDSLTDLPNRFIFDKFCSEQNSLTGCTFVVDLNNFKNINDSLGHQFGDLILKELANFLKNNFIGSYIFRISGDEFYGFSFESAETIIEKLKMYHTFCPTLLKYNITFNLGISYKTSEISLATSFRYSDLALLETKKVKNKFFKVADEKFIKKMDRETSILLILEDDIRGIYPLFQPKICIKNNRIIGAEALARYDSPKLGPIPPFEFIPIAEKYNFIHKVDYNIAKESIIFIKELLDSGISLDNFRISFNVSMKTFKRDDLIVVISDLLNQFKVPGKYIEIEITESIFILDMKDLITKLKTLKSLGIQISLDDFTAGHSTAGLLPLLPIDIVKFDKSLLDSIEINGIKGRIVYRNLTSLIKDLNFKIVSEGVETKEQMEFLEFLKVDYAQGYYFSRPITK